MGILSAFLVWALTAILLAWWLSRAEIAFIEDVTPPPPDPITVQVDKWMHDWERGRA